MDSEGRKVNNHSGPIPEGVNQLAPDSYLLSRTIATDAICGPSSDKHGGTDSTRTVTSGTLRGTVFVKCNQDITWNDHREKSPSFGTAAGRVGSSPVFLGIIGGLLLVMEAGIWLPDMRRERSSERAREEAWLAQQERDTRKRQAESDRIRKELRLAYARDEITEPEYEDGIKRLLDSGTTFDE